MQKGSAVVMAYLALYREWRPQRFDEVVGQDHVKQTLKNAIKHNRIAHAYLLAGPRGTGKTTVAKVLAKAVNCRDAASVEPCNDCEPCRTVTEGSSMDVLEIDAASNRGIDEIRELRERVRYSPAELDYKVYIIDEVHMLTNQAFNALLKTLEAPPEHVIFVLATTEPHKIPPTILSRCQRFDFHLLPTKLIAERLREVCAARSVDASPEVIALIARHAEGALRDALSLLDQVFSFGGDALAVEDVLAVLGTARDEVVLETVSALTTGQVERVMQLVDEVVQQGVEVRQFIQNLIEHCRNLLMVQIAENPQELVPATREDLRALMQQANQLGHQKILQLIDALSELDGRLRWSAQPRLVIEVELLRLTRNLGEAELDPIEGTTAPEKKEPEPERSDEQELQPATVERDGEAEGDEEEDEPSAGDLPSLWAELRSRIEEKSKVAAALLVEAELAAFQGGRLAIEFRYAVHRERMEKDHLPLLRDIASDLAGQPVEIQLVLEGDAPQTPATPAEATQTDQETQAAVEPEEAGLEAEEEELPPIVNDAWDTFGGKLVTDTNEDFSLEEGEQQEEDAS
jgi:DNA polymerase-3 subunit gamma/tau